MSSKANKIFGFDGSDNTKAYHSITADHPFMREIGLGVFTTGTLYNWWFATNGKRRYVNRELFAGVRPDDPDNRRDPKWDNPSIALYGVRGRGTAEDNNVWRIKTVDGAGSYDPFNLNIKDGSTWNWTSKQPHRKLSQFSSYVMKDAFPSFSNYGTDGYFDYWDYATNEPVYSDVLRLANYKTIKIDNAWMPFPNQLVLSEGEDSLVGVGGEQAGFRSMDTVMTLIDINNYINAKLMVELNPENWSKKELAWYALLLDIKSSKEGGFKWKAVHTFNVSLAGGRIACTKSDEIEFTLNLFGPQDNKKSGRSLAVGNMIVVKHANNALGQTFDHKNSQDGNRSPAKEEDPTEQVAGELDLSYNNYLGKWESGSPQLVAVVTQGLPAAKRPNQEDLKTLSNEEMLSSPGTDKAILFGSGQAMPIDMQNRNPAQWTPTNLLSTDCPDGEGNVKTQITCFNNSKTAIPVDSTVILSRIQGLWMAQPLPQEEEEQLIRTTFEGKWRFDYHATNALHFGRDKQWRRVEGDEAEKTLHIDYYGEDSVYYPQKDAFYKELGAYTGTGSSEQLASSLYQISSFDFMEPQVGGTRLAGESSTGKRSLATTNPRVDPIGNEIIPNDPNTSNGDEIATDGYRNGVFFGCVFPDGYVSESYSEFVAERDYATNEVCFEREEPLFCTNIAPDTIPFNFTEEAERNDVKDGLGLSFRFPSDEAGEVLTMFAGNNLDHLPADIATNASFDGDNGQPIPDMHAVENMYGNSNPTKACQQAITKSRWLAKRYEGSEDINQSAYNIRPRQNNRIMFCPLKAELYASIEDKPEFIASTDSNLIHLAWSYDTPLPNLPWLGKGETITSDAFTGPISQDKIYRIALGGQAAFHMNSKYRPTSVAAHDRERAWSINKDSSTFIQDNQTITNYMKDEWGLLLNASLPAFQKDDRVAIPGYIQKGSKPSNTWGVASYWGAGMQWVHGAESDLLTPNGFINFESQSELGAGAGAFGVIGAVATCSANTTINFTVENALGTWHWLSYGGSKVQGGFSLGFASPASVIPIFLDTQTTGASTAERNPSWGPNSRPDSVNTTVCHAMIYHAWPREQTVYDSRYLAVHHFNPDVETMDYHHNLTDNEVNLAGKYGNPNDMRLVNAPGVSLGGKRIDDAIVASGVETRFLNGLLPEDDESMTDVDYIGSSVDFRIPSYLNGINVFEASIGDTVYLDSIGDGGVNIPINEEYWKVDSRRRGKLLPYVYKRKTVGIGLQDYNKTDPLEISIPNNTNVADDGTEMNGGYIQATPDGANVTPWENTTNSVFSSQVDAVYSSRGQNYAIGDTLGLTIGSGVIFEVTNIADGGAVSEIKIYSDKDSSVFSRGGGMGYNDFQLVGDLINFATVGNVSVTSITGNGNGFDLSFTRGMVVEQEYTDEKPSLATNNRYTAITSRPPTREVFPGFDQTGYVVGTEEVSVAIDIPSADNRYDIFLRHQNDVSHTFMTDLMCWGSDRIGTIQYTDVTITMI